MYNKQFKLDIIATSPFAYEIDEEAFTGMTIVGRVISPEMDFLDDVKFGDRQSGLHKLLTGELPIVYPVELAFSTRTDEFLVFPQCLDMKCEVNSIELDSLDPEGKIRAKIKIKLKRVSSDQAGVIVSNLKQVVPVTVKSTQQELFENN